MRNRIITISREFGSGGREIGMKTAGRLGIKCYDNELLKKIAAESGFSECYIEDAGEYAPGGFLSSAFSHQNHGPNNADYLWTIQYNIITKLAENEACVIVGRCADSILEEKNDCLKIFIHADMSFRLNRVSREYNKPEEAAEQYLKKMDRRRASYHQFYTGKKWGLAQNYDLCLDSGRLGIARCVEIIAHLYDTI